MNLNSPTELRVRGVGESLLLTEITICSLTKVADLSGNYPDARTYPVHLASRDSTAPVNASN